MNPCLLNIIKMAGEGEFEAEKILVERFINWDYVWVDPFESSYGSINEDDWSMNPSTGMWGFGDIPMDDSPSGGGDSGYGMPTFTKGCMSFGALSENNMYERKKSSWKNNCFCYVS